MLDKGACLRYYKRKDVQEAIVEHALNKEVGLRYGESFGKRPDLLNYPPEILELAKRGVTSFHCSEELWSNPKELNSEMSRKELDELRLGWDLVLDIDCPDWEFSKLTTHLFIKALKDNGVQGISCKFSGNKGFHIGLPFESFPKEIVGKNINDLFPEGPRKISQYLLGSVSKYLVKIKDNSIIFDDQYPYSLAELRQKFGEQKFLINRCTHCRKEVNLSFKEENEFICPKCENKNKSKEDFLSCNKCQILMQKISSSQPLCSCGSNQHHPVFDPLSIIEIDTILIASRHLYRMPYSLHEKSGLASVPIDPEKVLQFEKSIAHPNLVTISPFKFLGREENKEKIKESARRLLLNAWDYEVKIEEKREAVNPSTFEEVKIESPIKEDFFPPCIKQILTQGMVDGRKRAVFILMNFLGKIGWQKKEIENYILQWNKEKNKSPLPENYIRGQLRYFTPGGKLPPNCDNEAYYKNMSICHPDALCGRLKNPVNYTLLRWKRWLRDNEEKNKKRGQSL